MARAKLVNGISTPLTAQEELDRDAEELAELQQAARRKATEARDYRLFVLHQNAFSEASWNILIDEVSRVWFSSVNNDVAAYLAGGGRLSAEGVNTSTGMPEIREVNLGQWNGLMGDVVTHDKAAQAAYLAILDRITVLGVDYAAINAIDVVTYPGTVLVPWPAFYED